MRLHYNFKHQIVMFSWLKKRWRAEKIRPIALSCNAGSESLVQAELTATSIAHKNTGDMYFDRGKFDEAAAYYRQAIACNPDYAEAHNNFSGVCRQQNLLADAEYHLRQAIRIRPGFANFHYNLATLQMEQKKLDEAIENFGNALRCEPNHHAAQAIMLHLMQQTCRWEELDSHIDALRRSVSTAAKSPESVFSPFVFIALPGTTPGEQKRCAENWVQSEYQSLVAFQPKLAFEHKRPRNNKITIGYLSADFREHPVARLMAAVFELHNRDRFHITAYSYGPDDGGEMRKRLQNAFDKFVDIRGQSDVVSATRIHKDNTDILVDLTGYTKDCRTGILALHPAPAQVNYLGYPGTMGASFVDYIITDRFVTPPEAQGYFSEKFVYMPHSFLPGDRQKEITESVPERKASGLPERGFVFCCFNKSYKLTPRVFAIWMRLLKALPGSVLWLSDGSPSAMENLHRAAGQHEVDPARVVFAPRVNTVAEHLARHRHADLFLDTLPYNAHTTCSDALWMGLPVVTCAGETFPSRVAGSLLTAMGVPELITYNLEDYYRLALDLATDRRKLDAIRSKIIANRDTTPLFDSTRFTRDLECAYIKIMSGSQDVLRHATID